MKKSCSSFVQTRPKPAYGLWPRLDRWARIQFLGVHFSLQTHSFRYQQGDPKTLRDKHRAFKKVIIFLLISK